MRTPLGLSCKVKPIINLDLAVIGYAESSGENAGKLRDLLLDSVDDDGLFQIVGKCGNCFS